MSLRQPLAAALAMLLLAGCAPAVSPTAPPTSVPSPSAPPPTAAAAPEVTCRLSGTPQLLGCGAVVTAVSTALGALALDAVSYDVYFGNYCPPWRGCRIPDANEGYAIVVFAHAQPVVASVRAAKFGGVDVTSIDFKATLDQPPPSSTT